MSQQSGPVTAVSDVVWQLGVVEGIAIHRLVGEVTIL